MKTEEQAKAMIRDAGVVFTSDREDLARQAYLLAQGAQDCLKSWRLDHEQPGWHVPPQLVVAKANWANPVLCGVRVRWDVRNHAHHSYTEPDTGERVYALIVGTRLKREAQAAADAYRAGWEHAQRILDGEGP